MYDVSTIALLGFVAVIAGFIDAIAGGGGLITLPALLLSGIPPVNAIATNKLQAAAGAISATLSFAKQGLIHWQKALPLAFMAFIGGILGAIAANFIPKEIFLAVAPILLIAVAMYVLFSPKLDNHHTKPKLSYFAFGASIAPLLGFYDGVFGPGTGSFFLVAIVSLLGYPLLHAISYAKLANTACNVGALLVFLWYGAIIFPIAITMAVGAYIGANLGARFAVRFGSTLIKPLLIVISLAMAIKLLLDKNNLMVSYLSSLF